MQRRLVGLLTANQADQALASHTTRHEAQRLDRRYREAFAEYLGGQDVDGLSEDAAVAALRPGGIALDLAAALDHGQQVTGEELGFVVDRGGCTSDFSMVRV